ncbi:hypothetical protein EIP86_005277 [Pleurotus ostreatoroseus]|nr:hypothetical protein EIP86_005277 [Pleurotus ostreatoroseus]
MTTLSPPTKRIKLEDDEQAALSVLAPEVAVKLEEDEIEADGEHCSICLQPLADRTVIPTCSHEFCFECLLVWTGQIGEYLIHHIRSNYDFQKHYLAPLRTSPRAEPRNARLPSSQRRRHNPPRREVQWGRNERRERDEADELERAIEKRRWHVASNSYTRYRPFPTPSQFAANQDLITRATIFVRRELRVWDSLDVEFLTTFTISLMKSLDIRSESAVKLLAEFLDIDAEYDAENPRANAEHFAHELYSYLRSPFRDLSVYDSVVQYDTPADVPPLREQGSSRWHVADPARSPSLGPSATRPEHASRSRPHQTRSHSPSTRLRRSPSHQDPHPRQGRLSISTSRRSPHAPTRNNTNSSNVLNGTDDVDMVPDESIRIRDVKGKGRARTVSASDQSVLEEVDFTSENRPTRTIDEDITRDTPGGARPADIADKIGASPSMVRTLATEEKPKERPRIRKDAWMSVQTHLAGSGTDRGAGMMNTATPPERVQPREELTIKGAATKSFSSTPSAEKREASSPEHGTASTTPAADVTASETPAILAETPPPQGKHAGAPKMTPQEIMARTRARLARLGAVEKASEDGEHAYASGTSDVKANLTSQRPSTARSDVVFVAAAPVGGDSDRDRDASAEAGSSASQLQEQRADCRYSSASEPSMTTFAAASPRSGTPPQQAAYAHGPTTTAAALRAKLLARLQDARHAQLEPAQPAPPREEDAGSGGPRRAASSAHGGLQAHTPERQATQTSIPAVTATVDRVASSGARSPASEISHDPSQAAFARRDAEMMESKLRAQAQLRVKLAAARRDACEQSTDVDMDVVARENALRARLKRA